MPYLTLFCFLLICHPIKNRALLYYSIVIMLVLFSGTRIATGWDWWEYELFYDAVPSIETAFSDTWMISHFFEPGFKVYTLFIKEVFGSFEMLLFITSLFSVFVICNSIDKYSIRPLESILLYVSIIYLYVEFSIVRQSIAIAIFLYSIRYIKEKCFIKYFLCCTIASLFHVSALALVPVYYFSNLDLSRNKYYLFIITGLIIFNVNYISIILSEIAPYLGPFSWKLINYVNQGGRGFSLGVVEVAVFSLIFAWFSKRVKVVYGQYGNIFINFQMIYFFLVFYCHEVFIMADRFKYYFLFSLVFLIPVILRLLVVKQPRIFISFCLLIISSHNSLKVFKTTSNREVYFPYESFVFYDFSEIERLKNSKKLVIENVVVRD